MPAAAPVEQPKPAPGEIKIGDLGKSGVSPKLPDSILAEARKLAGEQPDPPVDPPKEEPKAATPPPKETPKPPVAEPPKTPEPPKEPDDTPKAPKQLREALERAQSKVKEVETSLTATAKEKADAYAKLAEREAKVAQYEKEIETTYKPTLEKLSKVEKQLQEREEQLRIRDYTATQEWHEKYVKPEVELQKEVNDLLGELTANVDGQQIQATAQHFDYVISAPNQNEAAKRAEEVFGPHMSQQIASYRLKLKTLHTRKQEALKSAQLESAEWEKNQNREMIKAQEMLRNRIAETESKLVQSFKPADDDAELNEAWKKGRELADAATSVHSNLTREQIADLIAESRAEIQRSRVNAKLLERVRKENEDLKEQLKAYQKSEPDVEPRNNTPGSSAITPDDAHSKLLAAANAAANQP